MSGMRTLYIISIVCLLLTGCTSTPATRVPTTASLSPTPTEDQATAHPFATLRAEWTMLAQTPTRTPRPSATPTVTPTPYPTASISDVPLSPEGPWLVFTASTEQGGPHGLWAINSDGTGLKRLVDTPVLAFDPQPVESLEDSVIIAYVTQSDPDAPDLTLKTITLPSGKIETISALLDEAETNEILDVYIVSVAVRWGGLAWSPEGDKLAFASALNGESVDVYTYDVHSKTITRLTNSPEQEYRLTWSPDGRYVIHEGFPYIQMGGPLSTSLWAAHADGRGAVPLLTWNESEDFPKYSWLSPTEMLITSRCFGECNSEVLIANIETGGVQHIFRERVDNAAYAQGQDAWLLASFSSKNEPLLVLIKNGKRVEIPSPVFFRIAWSESQGVFVGETYSGERVTISLQGEIRRDPIPARLDAADLFYISASPDRAMRAWSFFGHQNEASELWVGEPAGEPRQILSDDELIIRNVTWSPDSRRLLIITYRGLLMAERPQFEPVRAIDGLYIGSYFGEAGEWIPQVSQGEE